MPLFAEIADKMPSIPAVWLWALLVSSPAMLGLIRPWLAWAGFVLMSGLAITLVRANWGQAFHEDAFSAAIRDELGAFWIANSMAASVLPVMLAFSILLIRRKAGKESDR